MRISVASAVLLLIVCLPAARALSASGDDLLTPAALADLELRADHAQPKEQCFLYTQLVHDYVEVAGKQMAAGDMDQATTSLKRVQTFADRIHQALAKDTKRVKNAEMLLHMAAFHLSQLMHLISSEDEALVQTTLKQLDKLHDELLTQVFSH
jgi:flagellin-specific chaperone FliS